MTRARQELVINAVPLLGDFLMPSVMQVAGLNEGVSLRYRPSLDLRPVGVEALDAAGGLRTMIGLRGGNPPRDAGAAVRRLGLLSVGLYASELYIMRHGTAEDGAGLAGHRLAHHDQDRDYAPWECWLAAHAPGVEVILRSNDELALRAAVRSGQCAAFMPLSSLLWNPHLRAVMHPREEWGAPLWLVSPPLEGLPAPVFRAVTMLGDLLTRCLGG